MRHQLFVSAVLFLLGTFRSAPAQVLFHDDFNGTSLDTTKWDQPVGDASYYGRTQQRPPGDPPSVSGGVVHLELDTYNPTSQTPGDSFYGTEIFTKQTFARGLAFEARVRYAAPLVRGLDVGMFAYQLNGAVRDEIDVELLSNDAVPTNTSQVFTNVFDDADFNQGGDSEHVVVPGLNLTQFNIYRVQWLSDRIQWFVNGRLVRDERVTIPDSPMAIHLNIWAPDQYFAAGYDAGLQPVSIAAQNQAYFCEVDSVTVASATETWQLTYPTPATTWFRYGDNVFTADDGQILWSYNLLGSSGAGVILGAMTSQQETARYGAAVVRSGALNGLVIQSEAPWIVPVTGTRVATGPAAASETSRTRTDRSTAR
jgi:hypothetical protein